MPPSLTTIISTLLRTLTAPPPKRYSFHVPGVWSQLDRTLRTLHTHYPNCNVSIQYQDLAPPPGHPLTVHTTIRIIHPELRNRAHELLRWHQGDLASTIILNATIIRTDNETELGLSFTHRPASFRYLPLMHRIAHHILTETDNLVCSHMK